MKFKFLHFLLKPEAASSINEWKDHSGEKLVLPEDKALFERMSRIMKSKPGFMPIAGEVVFSEEMPAGLEDIKQEIVAGNLDDIAKRWISEWESGTIGKGEDEREKAAIRDFIASSFKELQDSPEILPEPRDHGRSKLRFIFYSSSIAAAMIFGSFLLFRMVSDKSDTDRMFRKYYQPFSLVNNLTRGSDTFIEENISRAIECYKRGDYIQAVSDFSKALKINPSSNATMFFLGISKLGSGDLNGAVTSLEKVMNNKGDFSAEATWYLGLACLKTGNKEKAAECFEILTRNSEYYSRESGKILRHLK